MAATMAAAFAPVERASLPSLAQPGPPGNGRERPCTTGPRRTLRFLNRRTWPNAHQDYDAHPGPRDGWPVALLCVSIGLGVESRSRLGATPDVRGGSATMPASAPLPMCQPSRGPSPGRWSLLGGASRPTQRSSVRSPPCQALSRATVAVAGIWYSGDVQYIHPGARLWMTTAPELSPRRSG